MPTAAGGGYFRMRITEQPAWDKLFAGDRMLSRCFRGLSVALLSCAMGIAGLAQQPKLSAALPLEHTANGENSAAAQTAHYVVLVSLDGFRWDYAKRDGAKHLLAMGKAGVWAPDGMMPSYPSLTFPNHFSIVTGLYPDHHGLVANSF